MNEWLNVCAVVGGRGHQSFLKVENGDGDGPPFQTSQAVRPAGPINYTMADIANQLSKLDSGHIALTHVTS